MESKRRAIIKIDTRLYLSSGIMEGGIAIRIEGTLQGSPISPLLSNIILDELGKELEIRGPDFLRYADDISIYKKSEKSANRVMESVSNYIEEASTKGESRQEPCKPSE